MLSTVHIKHLVDMAPRAAWGEDFVDGVETWQAGPTLFVTHYATSEPMRFAVDGGTREPMAVGILSSPTRALRMGYDYARGAVNTEDPVLLAVCPTLADPGRAPAGKHTLKIIGFQPYDLKEGADALGRDQGAGLGRQPELPAALCDQSDRRQDPRPRGRKPARSRTHEPAQLARLVPWRRAERRAIGEHATGAGLGVSTACRSRGSIRPARPPIRAARSPAGPGRNAAAVMLKDFGTSLEGVHGPQAGEGTAAVEVTALSRLT